MMNQQPEFVQPEHVAALLRAHKDKQENVVVLDVRDDDFAGGNIRGCVNIPCWELLEGSRMDGFIDKYLLSSSGGDNVVLVVHCYLSQQRGPLAARRIVQRLDQRCGKDERSKIRVCVLAHGWRRFSQMYRDEEDLVEF